MTTSRTAELEIRRAGAADASEAARLMIAARHAALPAIPAPMHTDAEIHTWFTEHVMVTQEVWLAVAGSTLQAVLVLIDGWIEQLYVDPTLTGQGIGSVLVAHAKSVSTGELSLWTFASNTGAQQFYERHGFVEVTRTDGDNEEGAPDIQYRWRRTDALADELSLAVTAGGYSGVIAVHDRARPVLELAGGLADRAEGRPMTLDTRLATASGTKGFTALTVVSLIDEGRLRWDSRLVDVVDEELDNIDPRVTIEQLLGHTSGAGDYLDEEQLDSTDDYVFDVPVHTLLGPRDYLPMLRSVEQVEPPGSRFRYNNSGFVLLALVVECVTGQPYHDEVSRRVFEPAGMASTGFLRSDRLPAGTALGYLSDGRTNVHHLPVIGTGDGGAYTTAQDMIQFWDALFKGQVVSFASVERMTTVNERASADVDEGADSYGLGFWIGSDRTTVLLEGMDAGVSLRSGVHPPTGLRFCLIANDADGVWPLARIVNGYLDGSSPN